MQADNDVMRWQSAALKMQNGLLRNIANATTSRQWEIAERAGLKAHWVSQILCGAGHVHSVRTLALLAHGIGRRLHVSVGSDSCKLTGTDDDCVLLGQTCRRAREARGLSRRSLRHLGAAYARAVALELGYSWPGLATILAFGNDIGARVAVTLDVPDTRSSAR